MEIQFTVVTKDGIRREWQDLTREDKEKIVRELQDRAMKICGYEPMKRDRS